MCFFFSCRGPYLEQRGREGLKQEWFTKYFSFWAQNTHTHSCNSCKCISSYTPHCFLYTSVCFSHTQAHGHNNIKRNMGSSPAMPSLTLPQSSTKKCFSNTCLTSSLNIGLLDVICIVWTSPNLFFSSLTQSPFFKNETFALISSHNYSRPMSVS